MYNIQITSTTEEDVVDYFFSPIPIYFFVANYFFNRYIVLYAYNFL